MLNKIKDNNRGDIPLSFVFTIFILITFCCGFMDLFNIFRLKSVMIKEAQIATAACINQSGFKGSVPQDWTDVYGSLGERNYITSTRVLAMFKEGLENTIANKETLTIFLKHETGDKEEIKSSVDCIMQHNTSGELIFTCEYNLKYLNSLGLLNDELVCEVVNPVVAFWVHKNSSI